MRDRVDGVTEVVNIAEEEAALAHSTEAKSRASDPDDLFDAAPG